MTEKEDVEVDEDLGSYFECVPTYYKKRWVAEEVYMRKCLGLKTLSNRALHRIRTTRGKNKTLKNSPNYEVLSNDKYVAMF